MGAEAPQPLCDQLVSAEWRRTVVCGVAAQVFMVHQTNLHQNLDSNRQNEMIHIY